jgi:putative ABC transport system permease protein
VLLKYSIRSLFARKGDTLVVVLVTAAVTWASLVSLCVLDGVRSSELNRGRESNIVVLRKGAKSEAVSSIDKGTVDVLRSIPGIRQEGSQQLLSPELATTIFIRNKGATTSLSALVRGVDPQAYAVHPQVKLQSGRFPAPGAEEVMAGRQLVARDKGLDVGGSVPIGRTRWPIVGVFRAERSSYENELWGDRNQLATATNRGVFSMVVLALDATSRPADAVARFKSDPRLDDLDAYTERDYCEMLSTELKAVTSGVALIILLVGAGAVLASAGMLDTSILRRKREFATLIVLGFRRGRVSRLLVGEAVILTMIGALLGTILVSPVAKLMGLPRLVEQAFDVSFELQPALIGLGVALGLVMGLLGSGYPAFTVKHIDVISPEN